jgi:methionine-rich copper-binding protein CopC
MATFEREPDMNPFTRLLAFGGAFALLATGPAVAHTELVRSSPAANATVKTSPRTITLTFNERVVPAFSKFELTMPAHGMKVPVRTTVSADGKRIVGTVGSRLMTGTYKITWTAAGADGHRMTGDLSFRVG